MPPPPLEILTAPAALESLATAPTAEPEIELRQIVQSNLYVTLTVTREGTTFTTTILLAGTEPGAAPSSSIFTPATNSVAPTSTTLITSSVTTTTIAIASPTPTPTPAPTTAPPPAAQTTTPVIVAGSTDPTSGAVIGAIVGSIVGSLFFILLLWLCFYRTVLFRARVSTVSGSSRGSSGSDSVEKRPRRVRRVRVTETTRTRVRDHELDDD